MQKFDFYDFLERFMNDVDEHELFKVLEDLPDIIKGEMWLAGGSIRRTLAMMPLDSDFDFFFNNEAALNTYAKSLEKLGASKTSSNNHQTTYSIQAGNKSRIVQLIKIGYYKDVRELLDTFDFTITQFAYDGEYLYCGEYSLWDLARKRLALHKLTYGVATMRRMLKYTNQGFTACAGVMQSILQAVIDNPSTVRAEVEYVD